GLAFVFASPRQFHQTLQWAKTQAQPWLDRIAGRSSSASLPVSQSSSSHPAGVDQGSSSAGVPLAPAGEHVRKEKAAGADKEKTENRSSARPVPAPLGTLEVSSTPPDAQIIFDDKDDAGWMTPFTFEEVPSGRHTLEIKKGGYGTERRIFVLLGKETQRINV